MTIKELRPKAMLPLLVATLFAACGGGSTEPDLGTIRGTVRDNSGSAIASVGLRLSRTGRTPKTASSDAQGAFSFPRVEPGNWELEITVPSAYTLPQTQTNPVAISVGADRTATVAVTLNRKTGPPVDR